MLRPSEAMGSSTSSVHAGTGMDAEAGGVNTPIHTSTAYAHPHPSGENTYPRYFNTRNQAAVARKAAVLEGGEAGLVLASGMAAISAVLLCSLEAGDHAIFQADLYGGTRQLLVEELARRGVEFSFARTLAEIESAIGPRTRLLYVETPSNPLLRCLDLEAAASLARSRGLLSVADNTFATPINQNPLRLGMDVVVHSATKYLNGHSDLSAGVVVSRADIVGRVARYAVNLGGVLDAWACYQLERGMKTLALRVRHQNEVAGRLARFLAGHAAVARAHYPGLTDHPDHAVAARQMRGFGGMLSFELRDPGRVEGLLSRLRIARSAVSLGGVETLVCLPARTSHLSLSPEERREAGVGEGLVRVSVGIEDAEDLLEDFATALER